MLNHTTHPQGRDSHNLNKYIWRFIALSTAQPRVITIEATSEQEARQQSPAGCVMVFAARIRQGGGVMLKTFRVFSRAVNKRGYTVGITQNVKAENVQAAISTVINKSAKVGLSGVIIHAVTCIQDEE
ncbi:host cell division inhibitor Icd-like protein [Escherichia coli]